jgi:S-adenosylmethionine:tRNA ribosyltransferase-isomerase
MSLVDFDIPEDRIAQHPYEKRDLCKLLVLDKKKSNVSHYKFKDIVDFITPKDLIIFNDSKVLKAKLFGKKETGGAIEIVLLKEKEKNIWNCLMKGKNIKKNSNIFLDNLKSKVLNKNIDVTYDIKFYFNVLDYASKKGVMPLPPYIKRASNLKDLDYYQTVFSKKLGSVASPTASLHFTKKLLEKIKNLGTEMFYITLHVGYGTFSIVRDPNTHTMHKEFFSFDKALEQKIKDCKKRGGRVWAVGTTVVRTVESCFDENFNLVKNFGETNLFIKPGYKFKVVDKVITNFHHPRTSLMYLVCAFAGKKNIEKAYKNAIENDYKFLSYGDSMAII